MIGLTTTASNATTPGQMQGQTATTVGSSSQPSQVNSIDNFQDLSSILNGGSSQALERGARAVSQGISNERSQAQKRIQEAIELPRLNETKPQVTDLDQLTQDLRRDLLDRRGQAETAGVTLEAPPYEFKSPRSPFRDEIEATYIQLYNTPHQGYKRDYARAFGLGAIELADESYVQSATLDAYFYKEVGKAFLDIALGIDPVTGFGRSLFELVSGKNVVTGVELTKIEHAFAFVGVASMGTSGIATRAFTGIGKFASRMDRIYRGANHLLRARQARQYENFAEAVRKGEEVAIRYQKLLTKSTRRNRLTNIHESNFINPHAQDVFKPNSHVIEGRITGIHGMDFKQVVQEGVDAKPLMFRRSEIHGLNPSQVKAKLVLPESVKIKVNEIRIPEGTAFLKGKTTEGTPVYYIKHFRSEYIMDSPLLFE